MYKKLSVLLFTGLFIFSWTKLLAQDPGFIQQEIIKKANIITDDQINGLSVSQKQTVRAYYDGFGRSIQNVTVQASPLMHDQIQSIVYDNLGRQTKSYLPYADENVNSTIGNYRPNAVSIDQPGFYGNSSQYLIPTDAMPYAQQVYDNSPLQRLLQVGTVGSGFQPVNGQHFKSLIYRSNNGTIDGNILQWNVDGTYNTGNYYGNSTLTVIDGRDEENIENISFTDLAGHLVLKRQVLNGTNMDTYYIYNRAGMITYVIPPGATNILNANSYNLTATPLCNLVFHYFYNSRGQVTQKTIPGKGLISTVYDPLNRPVLEQDANMAPNFQWRYVKYDAKGRPISHGIYTDPNNGTYTSMQTYVYSLSSSYIAAWYESRSGAIINSGNYTNNIFPNGSLSGTTLTPLEYDYYDDYDLNQDGNADFSYIAQQDQYLPGEETATTAQLKGMPTIVSKSTVSGLANTWITTVTFYDRRLNPIQTLSNNHVYYTNMTMTDSKTVAPDFMGMPIATKVVKQTSAVNTITVYSQLTYDHMYRINSVSQKYNSDALQPVAAYLYNELGQVINKGVGYVSSSSWLQNIDMRYNIRGQLLSINNSTLTADGGVMNNENSDVFGMQLLYDKTDSNLGNTGKFNGEISAVKWMSKDAIGNNSKERAFIYSYDSQGRYNGETYLERQSGSANNTPFTPTHGWDETGINYDANGNILSLNRNAVQPGSSTVSSIDNLSYNYDSNSPNQLLSVADLSGSTQGFMAGNGTYSYDLDGNLTSDPYKGISNIHYSSLNRTSKIVFSASPNRFITYVTDANGTSLHKQQYDNVNGVAILKHTTDYIDNFVFVDGVISYFTIPEGRVVNNGGTLTQEFSISDQQGNVRVSFNNAGVNGMALVVQENSYYGFGLIMPGSTVTGGSNKNLYNGGSEWQNDFQNLPDYYQTYYRNYDPALGRFMSVDPKAESAASLTGYQYAGNNPIMNNDPMGDLIDHVPNRDPFSAAQPRDYRSDGFTGQHNFDNHIIDVANSMYDLNGNLVSMGDNGTVGNVLLQLAEAIINSPNTSSSTTFSGSYFSNLYEVVRAGNTFNVTGGHDIYVQSYDGPGRLPNGDLNILAIKVHIYDETANQGGGPGPSWWQSLKDYWANVGTAAKMTAGWALGVGDDSRVFMNDRVANAMRNSPGIVQARNDFYSKNKTSGNYAFGLKGLWQAGGNPIEQFVGSFSYSISVNQEGGFLQYTLTNTTSFSSFDYHITPASWNWNSGPMGNFYQTFIFTEPLRK